MFQGVRVFDPRLLFYGRHPKAHAALVPKRRPEACGARRRGLLRSPPPQQELGDRMPRPPPFPLRPRPLILSRFGKRVAPGGGSFSAAHLRSESKKRGTSARSAPVPRVFEAFGTRIRGRRRGLPPFSRPPHASSTPPTPQAPLSVPQNIPAPHPPVPASPCPRPPRAEARWGVWSSRPTRIPGNRPQQGRLR